MKSKTKWLTALLMLVFGFIINAHLANPVHAASKEPVLKVGMEANYPPYNWTQTNNANGAVPIDGSKQYANGYDVQIAKIIGKKLHRKVVVEKTGMVF